MAEWSKDSEKVLNELLFSLQPQRAGVHRPALMVLTKALREAEARGMERAAKLVGGFRKITYPEALNATEVGAHNAFVTRLQKAIQEDAGTVCKGDSDVR